MQWIWVLRGHEQLRWFALPMFLAIGVVTKYGRVAAMGRVHVGTEFRLHCAPDIWAIFLNRNRRFPRQ